jgi:hypothetical protein
VTTLTSFNVLTQENDDLYFIPSKSDQNEIEKDSPKQEQITSEKSVLATHKNLIINRIKINDLTKKYYSEGVISIDSLNKEGLFNGTYTWLSNIKYVNSGGSKGISLKEIAFNRIIVNQYYINSNNHKIRFTLTFEFKDSKFKYN